MTRKLAAQELERAGIDYLDVSAGIYESTPMICASLDMPIGYLTYLAAAMKEVVSIPIITTGRINDMVFAESILENNQADFVHMVRAFHADPEILNKSQKGQMDDVCLCVGCNKCVDVMLAHLPDHLYRQSRGRPRERDGDRTRQTEKEGCGHRWWCGGHGGGAHRLPPWA